MLALKNPAETLLDRVASVLTRVFETTDDCIALDAAIRELPNADSARILEAIVALEDDLALRLPDEQLFRLETVRDLVTLLEQVAAQEA